MSQANDDERPPSRLDKFKLQYEYDITISEVRKLTKKRTQRNGKPS